MGALRARLQGENPYVDAVLGVSLQVREATTVALVGESGSGKTTLGRAIIGLVAAREGSIRFAGAELLGLSDRALQAAPARHRDDVPGPGRLAQPAPHHPGAGDRALPDPPPERSRSEGGGAAPPRDGRAERRLPRPLSARALGRPGAPGRHRPRARAGAQADHRRRADRRARRLGPGRDPEPVRAPQGPPRHRLPADHPQPAGGAPGQRPYRDHVSRPAGRAGPDRGGVRPPCASLYPGPPGRDAQARPRAAPRRGRAEGRDPEPRATGRQPASSTPAARSCRRAAGPRPRRCARSPRATSPPATSRFRPRSADRRRVPLESAPVLSPRQARGRVALPRRGCARAWQDRSVPASR